jgi:hypothetical protein
MTNKDDNIIKLKHKRLYPKHREQLADNPDLLAVCEKATSLGMELLSVNLPQNIDSMPLDELEPDAFREHFIKRNTKKK